MLRINDVLSIPEGEISFTFSRSSGPGGQNVNKLNTRATLLFDVAGSPSLSERQRSRILERLGTRISREGIMRVVSRRHRTQRANREAARGRFAELLREALASRRPRRRTKIPAAARERRLARKKRRGRLKAGRMRPSEADER
jgi:ribosome-associated protein